MNNLSEKRKADRAKMADLLVEAMVKAGAKAVIEPSQDLTRRVDVRIFAPGGAGIHVDFNGGSTQPDVHVCTWNTHGAVFLDPDIGSVNLFHYGKATRVCYGLDDLIDQLRKDVERFVDGSGYLSHDDPRIVAMKETYKERCWTWPA